MKHGPAAKKKAVHIYLIDAASGSTAALCAKREVPVGR
jgi:hypothetical protein